MCGDGDVARRQIERTDRRLRAGVRGSRSALPSGVHRSPAQTPASKNGTSALSAPRGAHWGSTGMVAACSVSVAHWSHLSTGWLMSGERVSQAIAVMVGVLLVLALA